MQWMYYLDIFGTFVFTISGVSIAIQKRFDLVGTFIIGFVTAIGGGTIRDLLIGRHPVGWLMNRDALLAIFLGFVCCLLFYSFIKKLRKGMFLFDTIGIGLFTVLGIKLSLNFGLMWESALMLGVVSAVFGGVVRDVLCNEVPLIFRKEIYASACMLGGIVYLLLSELDLNESLVTISSMLVVIATRYFAIINAWSLDLGIIRGIIKRNN